jgi:hypothetical protein
MQLALLLLRLAHAARVLLLLLLPLLLRVLVALWVLRVRVLMLLLRLCLLLHVVSVRLLLQRVLHAHSCCGQLLLVLHWQALGRAARHHQRRARGRHHRH